MARQIPTLSICLLSTVQNFRPLWGAEFPFFPGNVPMAPPRARGSFPPRSPHPFSMAPHVSGAAALAQQPLVSSQAGTTDILFLCRSDASLYCDDVDIRFSKTMNSCKVLQIRYASVERLLERLTDLRFLSIDFLNTFLHSYRVFTTALVVLDKLITIYKKPISAIPAR